MIFLLVSQWFPTITDNYHRTLPSIHHHQHIHRAIPPLITQWFHRSPCRHRRLKPHLITVRWWAIHQKQSRISPLTLRHNCHQWERFLCLQHRVEVDLSLFPTEICSTEFSFLISDSNYFHPHVPMPMMNSAHTPYAPASQPIAPPPTVEEKTDTQLIIFD